METVLKAIADWIKGILTAGIMSNLSGLFDDVNTQVGNIAQQVGTKPSSFEPRVFAMIEALSRNVVLPIAGIILTFIACYELIEMITQHNNIYEKMLSMGIRSLSAYIRKMALDGYCLNLDLPQLRRMAYLLQMCSNNLNQYAKAANENGRVYAADMEDLRQRLDELIEIGRQILSRLAEL